MKTYTKQDFHNPEQLTRQQVGEGYRLLLPEEVDGRWAGNCGLMSSQREWVTGGGGIDDITYRVPLATPLPDGTVLSSNECCWSDNGFNMTKAFSHSSKTEPSGTTVIPNLWGDTLKPRKVTYIAGSMSAHPDDYNFPAFYAAAESLEKQGYFPINPAELDRVAGYTLDRIKQLDPVEFQEFLRGAAKRDLDALQQCDAIALLPGWENSKGVRAEKAVAEWLGLKTYTISPDNYGKWWLVIAEDVERINSKQENCEYCQGPCQSSTPSGCVGAEGVGVFGNLGPCSACIGYDGTDGESVPVDILSEKAPQISDAKQPDADDWIPHIPGDPMPCAGDSIVDIIDRDGNRYFGYLAGQMEEYWSKDYMNPIVKWRPAQPKQPYNSDERAEWGVDAPTATSTPQYASDDPKGAAGAKKAPMWLLPPYALQQTAWVHKHGAVKYLPYNWRGTGVCATTYISAIMRHLDAWRDGEDNDPESGISHIAHVAASCNILLDAQHCGKLNDDRAKLN